MTRFNELLNTGARYARGVGILLGTQEQEGVTTVAPELMPILDPDGQLDRLAAIGYILLVGLQQGLAAGGVGFRSQIALDNPADSNHVVEFEKITFVNPTALQLLFLGWSATQLTGSTGNLVARDSRQIATTGFSAPSSIRIRTQNNAAFAGVATNIADFDTPVGTNGELELGLVIAPGHSVRIFPSADNTAINAHITFFARVRAMNVRELQL